MKRRIQGKIERSNNSTRPRDSEAIMKELLQSQGKVKTASLSHSIILWESERAVSAAVFILYAVL